MEEINNIGMWRLANVYRKDIQILQFEFWASTLEDAEKYVNHQLAYLKKDKNIKIVIGTSAGPYSKKNT
jgi:hypothetical protein